MREEWKGEKKRFWINIQDTREYLEGGNQVSPKLAYHIQGVHALRHRIMGGKPISKDLGRSCDIVIFNCFVTPKLPRAVTRINNKSDQ